MKRRLIQVAALGLLSFSSAWATYIFDTNPGDFTAPVDWCQFGCAGAPVGSDVAYTGGNGGGIVGLFNGADWENAEQGSSWNGNFITSMGVVYNNAANGTGGTDIFLSFNQGQNGGGAYIDTDTFGAETLTVTALDEFGDVLFSSSTTGTANTTPGTAPFIGIYDDTGADSIWTLVFDASGTGAFEPDFAIGTAILNDNISSATPEPATLVPVGLGLLGLAWRQRKSSRRGK
jgi:PEP-CTERM motif